MSVKKYKRKLIKIKRTRINKTMLMIMGKNDNEEIVLQDDEHYDNIDLMELIRQDDEYG